MPSQPTKGLLPLGVFKRLLGASSASSLVDLRDFFYDFEPHNGNLTRGQNELLKRAIDNSGWAPEVLDFIEDHLEVHGIDLAEDFDTFFWKNSVLEHKLRSALDQLTRKLDMVGSVTWNQDSRGQNYSRGGVANPLSSYTWSNTELRNLSKKHPLWAVGRVSARVGFPLPGTVFFRMGLFEESSTPNSTRTFWGLVSSPELFSRKYSSVSGFAAAVKELVDFIEDLT